MHIIKVEEVVADVTEAVVVEVVVILVLVVVAILVILVVLVVVELLSFLLFCINQCVLFFNIKSMFYLYLRRRLSSWRKGFCA